VTTVTPACDPCLFVCRQSREHPLMGKAPFGCDGMRLIVDTTAYTGYY
jgi:hypothetical protein